MSLHDTESVGAPGPRASAEPGFPDGSTRRSFLKHSTIATTAVVPATILAVGATEAHAQNGRPGRRPAQRVRDLYRGSEESGFRSIQKHENDHVRFLAQQLGTNAIPRPQFVRLEQPDLRTFERVSQLLENTGVGAYTAAGPLLFDKGNLAKAGSIATIESRHASFLNALLNDPLGNFQAFETPLRPFEVVPRVTPFFANPALAVALGQAISPVKSPANDLNILRFALALEYLESEFYNINVPKFFG